jgi:secreted trypsin-like serine protease
LTRDLVLTAAHCVVRNNVDYQIKAYQAGIDIPARTIVRHPGFDHASYTASRATADVALIKLAAPLPDDVIPASLAAPRRVSPGETLTIAGFGVTIAGTARGLGQPRMATLTVTGKPGSLQIRLYDIATRNQRIGLGGCTGDSGAPAYDGEGPLVIGVVSWSTAPGDETGCGGLTGITPLLSYRDWIIDTARKLNSPLAP